MSTLGVLGGKQRRGSTNGVLSGLGKLTSPTEWTIDGNEWPSTVSHAVVNSWTRWKELAYPGSGLKATSSGITPWKVGQVVKLPPSWVPQSASPAAVAPAATVAAPGVPLAPGVPADPLAPAAAPVPAMAPSAPSMPTSVAGVSMTTIVAGVAALAAVGYFVFIRKPPPSPSPSKKAA